MLVIRVISDFKIAKVLESKLTNSFSKNSKAEFNSYTSCLENLFSQNNFFNNGIFEL